jgi:RimJ/RimL family protein N-acetyltransferase/acyl carrier protein
MEQRILNDRRELPEDEFYSVLDSVVPGDSFICGDISPASRIYFTRLSMSGLQEMHAYSVADTRFYDYLEYDPFESIVETEAYLKGLIDSEGEAFRRSNIGWFLRTVKNDKIIGTARFVNIDWKRQSVAWGYGIDPLLWGQGYVQEVQRALLDYIFNRLRLNRLYGSAIISNKQTISTLLSIGMKEEGRHREAMRDSKGAYHDSWSYAMLYEDYKNSRGWNISSEDSAAPPDPLDANVSALELEAMLKEFLHEYGDVDIDYPFAKLRYWDSLKQMELLATLEGELGISITIDQIIRFTSIRAVVDALARN